MHGVAWRAAVAQPALSRLSLACSVLVGMPMSDDKEEVPKKGGKKKLVLALIIFNLLAAAGVGYFVIFGEEPEEEEGDSDEEGDEEEGEPMAGKGFGPLVEMKPLVGNLDDPGAGRYVKIKLHIEIKSEDDRPQVEAALVPIRSELLVYFTGVKPADTIGSKNKKRIIADVTDLVEGIVGSELVRRVFFTEFVTQ